MKTKLESVLDILRASRTERQSNAEAKRVVASAKALGLSTEEIVSLMGWLDYCREGGEPWNKSINRVW